MNVGRTAHKNNKQKEEEEVAEEEVGKTIKPRKQTKKSKIR